MPVEERFVCRFAAEPPQELLPYGRWAETLTRHFLGACDAIEPEADEDLGEMGELLWYPERTWNGRTYVPATAMTSTGFELFGFVSFRPGTAESDPSDYQAIADYTDETADANPDWQMDINDEVIGTWRGEQSHVADMTLVWGRPMISGGVAVTAELAGLTVDQCELISGRFTLIAPDNYRYDTLECKLFDKRGQEIASESLYAEDDDDD